VPAFAAHNDIVEAREFYGLPGYQAIADISPKTYSTGSADSVRESPVAWYIASLRSALVDLTGRNGRLSTRLVLNPSQVKECGTEHPVPRINAEKLAYDEFVSPPWAGENADDIGSMLQWRR
jgi:hypothetical protein